MNNVLLISCIHVHHNLYAYRNTLNEDIYDKHLKNIFVVVKCPALKKKHVELPLTGDLSVNIKFSTETAKRCD